LFCDNKLFDVSENLRHTNKPFFDCIISELCMSYLKPLSPVIKLSVAQAAIFCIASITLIAAVSAHAQTAEKPIYRCPSANGITPYTNDKAEADRQKCTLLTGGNVTIVSGTKVAANSSASSAPSPSSAPVRVAAAPQAGSRIDGAEQRNRDSDSRAILEAELKKAEAKQAELLKEYNNGEPGKIGGEAQNNQKYLDRVAEMKANIARNDSDIAGIKRELGRNPTKSP
jgi:zona occludens toxin (predicted ATPase)